ncbi:competence type IV pilus major pilin ComGC [Bacillus sp. N1-1]|jgi:competence protein ComGC|uniref:competence type IV pilus major pilin ComGC n=1 Tax=Bacillus sp. N1-1 TaxID=2682541 RepID=UPI001319B01F|nr:competence type IV pilus major pilin ComGC [Bacillus sp. N1-1]QHA92546.1 prepilin-type N-terminal cleavage/methylation domain-containing protein [Bacillus sp. N1-1]
MKLRKWISLFKQEKGFTLIEMMIVIMIISVLLLIAVPGLTKNNKVVEEKSCEATIKVAQTQVAAYKANENKLPAAIDDLVTEEYLDMEETTCPGGEALTITDGKVDLAGE